MKKHLSELKLFLPLLYSGCDFMLFMRIPNKRLQVTCFWFNLHLLSRIRSMKPLKASCAPQVWVRCWDGKYLHRLVHNLWRLCSYTCKPCSLSDRLAQKNSTQVCVCDVRSVFFILCSRAVSSGKYSNRHPQISYAGFQLFWRHSEALGGTVLCLL